MTRRVFEGELLGGIFWGGRKEENSSYIYKSNQKLLHILLTTQNSKFVITPRIATRTSLHYPPT